MPSQTVRRVDDIFALSRFTVHHAEVSQRGTGLAVTTKQNRWVYAVEFPKSVSAGSAQFALVDVLVECGRVAVGALSGDGKTFLYEQEVGSNEGPVSVVIESRDLDACVSLMIRNVHPDGEASRVLIEAIRVYDGPQAMPVGNPAAPRTRDCFADIMRLTPSAQTIVDIGANIGDTVAKCRDVFPSSIIHAIEPTPDLLQRLRNRFVDQSAVFVHGLAISDRNGSVPFHCNKNHVTNSILPWDAKAKEFVDGPLDLLRIIEVPCLTLTSFCDQRNIGAIDFLKVDVQGAEKLILEGARELFLAGRIKVVLLEASFVSIYANQTNFGDILNFMQANEFNLFNFYDFRYGDSGQVKWGDALFFRPDKNLGARIA